MNVFFELIDFSTPFSQGGEWVRFPLGGFVSAIIVTSIVGFCALAPTSRRPQVGNETCFSAFAFVLKYPQKESAVSWWFCDVVAVADVIFRLTIDHYWQGRVLLLKLKLIIFPLQT